MLSFVRIELYVGIVSRLRTKRYDDRLDGRLRLLQHLLTYSSDPNWQASFQREAMDSLHHDPECNNALISLTTVCSTSSVRAVMILLAGQQPDHGWLKIPDARTQFGKEGTAYIKEHQVLNGILKQFISS